MEYENLINKINSSNFNLSYYEISMDVQYVKQDLIYWNLTTKDKAMGKAKELVQSLTFNEVLERITPKFQRDNDKWNQQMQIKFVENIILGAQTTIILGTTTNEKSECLLIDGLQRVSAIFAFMNKEFKVFNEFEYKEEFDKILSRINNFKLRIYNFKKEIDLVQFYIDMNENITHSKEDIEKAKKYLKSL